MTERPETVKLHPLEWAAIYMKADSTWGIDKIEALVAGILGPERIASLKRKESTKVTKKEIELCIKAVLPLIPVTGATPAELRQNQMAWLVDWAGDIFTVERLAAVVAYAKHRITEWESKPAPAPAPVGQTDAIDVKLIKIIGNNKIDVTKARMIPGIMKSANYAGSNVNYSKSLPPAWWNDRSDAESGPRLHIYWPSGTGYVGGHYEWTHFPGQSGKTLKNIRNGYLGDRPPVGSPIFFCDISHNGKERSAIVQSKRNWEG